MIIIQNALLALLMAAAWMIVTAQINLAGLLIGFVLSFALAMLLVRDLKVNPLRLPLQVAALLVYVVVLARDIFLSGIEVMLYVLNVKQINPGIAVLPVGDESEVISALTAHGITITPGQLVVDYDNKNNVYVHCLDIASAQNLEADQRRRLALLRKVVGQ